MEIPVKPTIESCERTTQDHLRKMQRYVARVAITQSVFRPNGGCVHVAIEFLGSLDLNPLKTKDPLAYPEWLNVQTKTLMTKLPPIKNIWGQARKSINIFMTMASLNRFLSKEYALERLEDVLEVPLDKEVGTKLSEFGQTRGMFPKRFPKWTTVTALDSTNSEKYQQVAQAMATERRIPRGRLDVILWEATKN